ncbi:hypothetical protein PR202_ga00599 [Eleusine coracana subsp. coracana]|uniref:Uncharacterized protein n=1 Tax=Eleusine coracana subsp. coracana TaxID=191504 RepID=A0AAV5BFW4_ELECO|nr:hypothetical protein QOZ80_2AG0129100 [Eleusine coracana subsp. coracana]GJM84866.1 hypothetical protein PR202_ga00577 [Eleusine coracana subsp. coracana]GJM84886.1 hypothetical protein PR202_ga00599 [Eleusine coracana subsp. coracana]
MTVNGFERHQDGGGPSECDGQYHSNKLALAALSTRWYANGQRCHKKIRITSVRNGRSVEATVVDECDSRHGCKNNIVDTSKAVWEALGLDTNIGEVPVTWSDV